MTAHGASATLDGCETAMHQEIGRSTHASTGTFEVLVTIPEVVRSVVADFQAKSRVALVVPTLIWVSSLVGACLSLVNGSGIDWVVATMALLPGIVVALIALGYFLMPPAYRRIGIEVTDTYLRLERAGIDQRILWSNLESYCTVGRHFALKVRDASVLTLPGNITAEQYHAIEQALRHAGVEQRRPKGNSKAWLLWVALVLAFVAPRNRLLLHRNSSIR